MCMGLTRVEFPYLNNFSGYFFDKARKNVCRDLLKSESEILREIFAHLLEQ